uniref:Venom S1 protease 43 n=1 Tax=Platymeris rhadamanthus TaxID=1134088 RepID=A0A6B9KZF8_PLARH|nr:venom S1 protease 43 [Platymeris rhadamanthus]
MKMLFHTVVVLSLLGLGSVESAPHTDDSDSDSSEHGVIATDVQNNCTCGVANKEDQRIVEGRATKKHEYPLMVGIVRHDEDIVCCGGTIITPRHILTAAHCTAQFEPNELGIHIGYHNYEEVKKTTKLLEPQEFFIHDDYYYLTLKYDISVILTKQPIEFGANIGPACLPKEKIHLEGERVKVLGWGHTSYRGELSDVLLKVNLDIQPLEQCRFDNPHLELGDRHQICTFRKNKDSCNGDSGGPLLWRDPDTNRYTLVAITSYGYNCAKYPAVSSDVFYFLPWIQSIIAKTDPSYQTCAKM